MRVNQFATFCELYRALTPAAPRVGLARRPPHRLLPVRRRHGGVLLRDWDAFNCFYASEEFKRLSAHGAGFIGSIDTYLVQSHTVVEHPSDGGYWL